MRDVTSDGWVRRLWCAAVVAAVTVAMLSLATAEPAGALTTFDNVTQLDVATFVDAGVAVSERAYAPEDTESAVLTTDAAFPDGLAASAVAGAVGGPVLFTDPATLSDATAAEIDRLLDPGDTIIIMGGAQAVSPSVEQALTDAGYQTRRLDGATRLETAATAAEFVGISPDGGVLIARGFGPDGANTPSDRTTGWVDAISCGAYAAAEGVPILLTQTDTLSSATAMALADGGATRATICGGETAVSQTVADQMAERGITVDRVAGPTRVETAIDVATTLFGINSAAGASFTVVPGYGENFGYGLAAAPLGDPILLVGQDEPTACNDTSQPSRATLCFLQQGTEDDPARVLLIGGDTVVTTAVADAVGAASGGAPAELTSLLPPENVTARDTRNDGGDRLTVTWDPVADPDGILAGYTVLADGNPAPGETPTVGPQVTTYDLGGLTAGTEVSVTVVAVDDKGNQSRMSAPATATPTDERPNPLDNFDADPKDGAIELRWDRGPSDAIQYDIIRTTTPDASGNCPGDGEQTFTVNDPDQTTLVDDSAENDVSYCYAITVTDESDQTSEEREVGPLTPSLGIPSVTIQFPVSDNSPLPGSQPDTINYGPPVVIEYAVTDSDTDPEDLLATFELSYDGGNVYTTVADRVGIEFVGDDDGAATFEVPPCPPGDATSVACIQDTSDDDVRFRVTVEDGANSLDTDNTGDVRLERRPPPVHNFAATASDGANVLVWDRQDVRSGLVIQYRVRRASQQIPEDSEGEEMSCPDPATPMVYDEVEDSPIAQPSSGETVRFVDDDVDTGGASPLSDTLYCYLVDVQRLVPMLDSRDVLGAANPLAAPGIGVSIQSPPEGGRVDRGQVEVIRYQLEIPSGGSAQNVRFFYCVDYDTDEPVDSDGRPECQSEEIEITRANGLMFEGATPPASDGSNEVRWAVPENSSTSQGDGADEGGAIRVSVEGSSGVSGGGDRSTGLLFR